MSRLLIEDSLSEQTVYMPVNGFTTVAIGCERGNNSYNMVNSLEAPNSTEYMKLFDTLWNDKDIYKFPAYCKKCKNKIMVTIESRAEEVNS